MFMSRKKRLRFFWEATMNDVDTEKDAIPDPAEAPTADDDDYLDHCAKMAAAIIRDPDLDNAAKLDKIKALLAMLDQDEQEEEDDDQTTESRRYRRGAGRRLTEESRPLEFRQTPPRRSSDLARWLRS